MSGESLEPRIRSIEVDVAVMRSENDTIKDKVSSLEEWKDKLSEQWVRVLVALGTAGLGALAAFVRSIHK